MTVRYKHTMFPKIAGWYHKRGQPIPAPESMSDLGFIVDDRVAGFIYLTNSNLAIIEGVVANPDTVPSLRKASLKKLAGLLVDTAVSLGCTEVIAITKHPAVAELARYIGFRELPEHRVFLLSENDEGISDDEVYISDTDWLG